MVVVYDSGSLSLVEALRVDQFTGLRWQMKPDRRPRRDASFEEFCPLGSVPLGRAENGWPRFKPLG